MSGEQDIIKLLKYVDMGDPESAAVALSKNFAEIENKVGLMGGYLKQISGGSVADIVNTAGQWTQGARVQAAALITAVILGEVADGKIQAFFQAEEPAADMAYGDVWVDTDKVSPPDTSCVYRYEDTGGGSGGTLAWRANAINVIGKTFLDAYNAALEKPVKLVAYYQATMPYNLAVGDYWIDTDDSNQLYRAAVVGASSIRTGQWEPSKERSKTLSGSTYVVADGSTSNNAANADFIVPVGSTNAEITIQKALDALPATGGRVLLLDGTYTISNSIILDSNQTLEGQGLNTVIKCSDTFTTAQPGIICADTKSNIELWSFTLDGNRDNLSNAFAGIYMKSCTDVLICALTVTQSDGRGIHVYLGENTNISNCNLTYNDQYGIDVDSAKNCNISGCTVSYNNSYGMSLGRVSSGYDYCQDCSITGNILLHNTSAGIGMVGGLRNVVSSNIVSYNRDGIYLGSLTLECVISNNTVSFNENDGLTCTGDYCIITGNMVSTNSQARDNTYDNIRIGGSYNNVQNNTIRSGDTAFDAMYGIYIFGDYCLVTNNDSKNGGQTDDLLDNGDGNILTAGNRL